MAPCCWTSAPLSAKRGFGLDDRRPFPALKCWSKVQRHKVRRDKSQSDKKSCKTDSFRDVGRRNGRFRRKRQNHYELARRGFPRTSEKLTPVFTFSGGGTELSSRTHGSTGFIVPMQLTSLLPTKRRIQGVKL